MTTPEFKKFIPPALLSLAFAFSVYTAWYFSNAPVEVSVDPHADTFRVNKYGNAGQIAVAINDAMKNTRGYGIDTEGCKGSLSPSLDMGFKSHPLPAKCSKVKIYMPWYNHAGERDPQVPFSIDRTKIVYGLLFISGSILGTKALVELGKHEKRKLKPSVPPLKSRPITMEQPHSDLRKSNPIFKLIEKWGEDHEAEIAEVLAKDLAPDLPDVEKKISEADANEYQDKVLKYKGNL